MPRTAREEQEQCMEGSFRQSTGAIGLILPDALRWKWLVLP